MYKRQVLRYGLDTDSIGLKSIVGAIIEKGVVHPYEGTLFIKTFNYFENTESAEVYVKNKSGYPNNVVLIDIFDRSKGFINEGINQTHTIVLWKKKDNEIILIDPSNIEYSKHLCERFKLTPLNPTKNIIYGSEGKETGYSEYFQKEPKPRDCIDIAVKIALELNEQQKLCDNLNEIDNNMLQQISNQNTIAPHMILVKDISVRTLQSTNQHTRVSALYTLQQGLYMASKKK